MWRTAGTPGRTSCGVTTAGLTSCACPALIFFFFFFFCLHFVFHSTEKYKGNYAAGAVYRNNCTRSKTRVQKSVKASQPKSPDGTDCGVRGMYEYQAIPAESGRQ
jgi:hypothetical protein